MFDMEVLRNRQMIEEREIYENSFISIEDIIKSDEVEFQIAKYVFSHDMFEINEFYMNDFDWEFGRRDYLNQLRDEKMILEMQADELSLLSDIEHFYAEQDFLHAQIEEYDKEIEYQIEEHFNLYSCISEVDFYDFRYDEYYFDEINMDGAYCGGGLSGYEVEVDPFDSFNEIDYPEGPSENLNGFKYPEPDYPDEFYDDMVPEYDIKDYEPDYVGTEEIYLDKLIEDYLKEEKEFLKYVEEHEDEEEHYLPAGMEDIILI